MRTLIAVPAMDTVSTMFFSSVVGMHFPAGTDVTCSSSSLVYDARNTLARQAIDGGYDRVLWLDSDMRFGPDLLDRLGADLDEGRDMVCGLYFSRRAPVVPCVSTVCEYRDGVPTVDTLDEIPDGIFQVACCGFGVVLMTGDLLRRVGEAFGPPFNPLPGFGEDYSFCLRARQLGARLWCDPTVKVDHIGISIINEATWRAVKGGNANG